MTRGALALLITGGTENWAPQRWRECFKRVCPDRAVALIPDDAIDPTLVRFAAVWKPPRELFERTRVTKAIANLGAGVDALLDVPTLPAGVPVVRLVDAGMAGQMAEYVTLAVLAAYREQRAYADQQRRAQWKQRPPVDKSRFAVGLLGLGVLGRAVARPLTALALAQGGYDWALLAFAVGFGGSMVWFGSSAGVAITNLYPEGRSVGRWLKDGWFVAPAYVIGFFIMLAMLGWNPTAIRGAEPVAEALAQP